MTWAELGAECDDVMGYFFYRTDAWGHFVYAAINYSTRFICALRTHSVLFGNPSGSCFNLKSWPLRIVSSLVLWNVWSLCMALPGCWWTLGRLRCLSQYGETTRAGGRLPDEGWSYQANASLKTMENPMETELLQYTVHSESIQRADGVTVSPPHRRSWPFSHGN